VKTEVFLTTLSCAGLIMAGCATERPVGNVDNYRPEVSSAGEPEPDPKFGSKSARVLWAAKVWHSSKKHWVLELQRRLRAQHSQAYGG